IDTSVAGTIQGFTAEAAPQFAHGEVLHTPPQLTPEQAAQQEAFRNRPLLASPAFGPATPSPEVPVNVAATHPGTPIDPSQRDRRGYIPTSTSDGGPSGPNDFPYFRANSGVPANSGSSSVGEPNVGTLGRVAFQTGNWYAAVSGNYGTDFAFVNP